MNKRAYDAVWGSLLRTTTVLHKALDRATGGRLGRRFPGGGHVVWITTLGRRSGEWRRTPLLAARHEGAWVIAGSNAGQAEVPGWVFNVRDHAEGFIEVDGVRHEAVFSEVVGEERAALYRKLIDLWSSYAMYERNAGRVIPVFVVKLVTTPV